jgi:chorismate-pyruvate lyase
MNSPPAALSISELYAPFPSQIDRPEAELLPPEEIPEPYRELLVHEHHMTVTVEAYYREPVEVRVLEVVRRGNEYARKILLALRDSRRVVQFGIVQIDLAVLTPDVRETILAGEVPLGRVLIQNQVLRTVRPAAFFRAMPRPLMCEWFSLKRPEPTYGRIGVISTDGHPTIRVAEILAPIS